MQPNNDSHHRFTSQVGYLLGVSNLVLSANMHEHETNAASQYMIVCSTCYCELSRLAESDPLIGLLVP